MWRCRMQIKDTAENCQILGSVDQKVLLFRNWSMAQRIWTAILEDQEQDMIARLHHELPQRLHKHGLVKGIWVIEVVLCKCAYIFSLRWSRRTLFSSDNILSAGESWEATQYNANLHGVLSGLFKRSATDCLKITMNVLLLLGRELPIEAVLIDYGYALHSNICRLTISMSFLSSAAIMYVSA